MSALLLATLLAQVVPSASATPAASYAPARIMPATFPPTPPDAAIVRNSGSTNTAGYTIAIAPDGSAVVRQYDGFTRKVVGAAQTRWLFRKLREAAPLDALPTERCMKSASFGTSTTISWQNRTSADLSCGGDARAIELARTVGVIVRGLEIDTLPHKRRLHSL